MRSVVLADAGGIPAGNRWECGAADLALEVAAPLLDRWDIDALFVAAPTCAAIDGQLNASAVLADRLCLSRRIPVLGFENGDASGAAALHAAYAHVAAGLADAVLLVAVAKVSDETEEGRARLLDSLIDQEAETALGLTYMAQAALLSDYYLSSHRLDRRSLVHIVARNAANAVAHGGSFLKMAPTADELRRDIPMATPLVRSDFAPLLDGCQAVILAEREHARRRAGECVEILGIGAAADLTVVWDRADPLHFAAAAHACEACLGRCGLRLKDIALVEIDNPCTIVEAMALESIGLTPRGQSSVASSAGFGRLGGRPVVNAGGGQQGYGNALGVSGIAQAREIFLQFAGRAGGGQVGSLASGEARALAVSIAGLGAQAFVTAFGRPQ